MKLFIFVSTLMLAFVPAFAQQSSIGANTVVIGDGASSNKTIKFKKQSGATQPGIRYNSSSGLIELSTDGSSWVQVATVNDSSPVGMVMPYIGSSCPSFWTPADGGRLSRSTYSSLFAVVGVTYGAGDGSTTFNKPDYRGYFMRGLMDVASVTTTGSAASNNVTATAHGYNHSGVRVRVTGTPVTGLSLSTTYYVIYVDANTVAFATTHANALAGTKITISGSAALMQIVQYEDPDVATRLAQNAGGNTGANVGSIQTEETAKNSLALTDPGHNHTQNPHTHIGGAQGGFGSNISLTTGGATGGDSGNLGYRFQINDATATNNANTTGITLAGGTETRPVNASVLYCIKY